jgi:transcriptional regulator with XRE-family HTH domain
MRTNEIIGRRIEERLNEIAWGKKDLAKALDISQQMVSKITLAKKNITVQEIKEIAEVLGSSFEELTQPFEVDNEVESIMSFMGELTTQEAKDGLKLAQEIMDAIIENKEARRSFNESISNLV